MKVFAAVLLLGAILPLASAVHPFFFSWRRGITADQSVKKIHSHNDYWRKTPLVDALRLGVQSVEADVWKVSETLYVGHDLHSLSESRTFDSLYVQPLLKYLDRTNKRSPLLPVGLQPAGLFDTNCSATLYLFVDIKTGPADTAKSIRRELAPLRRRGWLTTLREDGVLVPAPVTVVLTGNLPESDTLFTPSGARDMFFDADLAASDNSPYDARLTPFASCDLQSLVGEITQVDGLSAAQIKTVTDRVRHMHSYGVQTRVWGIPEWPITLRNNIWHQLYSAGNDFLCTDAIESAAEF
ncbi:hypothetical protein CANCADRAFT_4557 [Tortispora caseinolytica NRRL Y-17796]|uniref:Altered inheritance of mitochondria protein 6 n=1 Tax=Tortispora caseinolytica NRRL Y-17796 TaxID=767744 RepID=A0A1E4T9J0_9ASCO|nr:hypothetical protein CANCADRAFT_4557 [Tortispora caseinolytica NRRL Y-17796]